MAEGSDAMPEQSAENQPPQTHSARDHVPPAVTYVPGTHPHVALVWRGRVEEVNHGGQDRRLLGSPSAWSGAA